ncbi:antitermination factor NusB [Ichthyobacterium seriolicida]|uniref:Antitermination factor NusB n=1 Tax=Ichthyobacterium seriolicida TaxID=242600 RepID=A0A1J1EA46_9FLAO|nr:antitermination factor NusB [Ichthyobacterium seriolicida]
MNIDHKHKALNELIKSIDGIIDLHIILLDFVLTLKKKALSQLEVHKNRNFPLKEEIDRLEIFVKNPLFNLIEIQIDTEQLSNLESVCWQDNDQFVKKVFNNIKESQLYRDYTSNSLLDFDSHKAFIVDLFVNYIAPEESIHDFLEDVNKHWASDVCMANTLILNAFKGIKNDSKKLPSVYISSSDRDFGEALFFTTLDNYHKNIDRIKPFLKNWDIDRLSSLDLIIIQMSLCEFSHFSDIPISVTINEYIEISKEYSYDKSRVFINGILFELQKGIVKDS